MPPLKKSYSEQNRHVKVAAVPWERGRGKITTDNPPASSVAAGK